MNHDLLALKPWLIMLAVVGLVLVVLWGLVQLGRTEYIVPTPEQEAEQFFNALQLHAFDTARGHLSQDLQQEVTADQLKEIELDLERSQRGIIDEHGESSQEQGDQATAQASVELRNLDQKEVSVPLTREDGLWKITSLDPLLALGGG